MFPSGKKTNTQYSSIERAVPALSWSLWVWLSIVCAYYNENYCVRSHSDRASGSPLTLYTGLRLEITAERTKFSLL